MILSSKYQYIFILILLTFSCDLKEDELAPEESFIKVYDVNNFNLDLEPVDIIQTSDSGYVILAKDKDDIPNILETNGQGEIQSIRSTASETGSQYFRPIGELMNIAGSIYFIAMNINLEAVLLEIEPGRIGTRVYSQVYQPLAASKGPGNEILIAGYSSAQGDEIVTEQSTFYVMTPNSSTPKYSYNLRTEDSFTDDLVNSYLNGEANFPFFTGYIGGESSASHYYVNTFYNFNLSTVFLNPTNDPDSQIEGSVIGDNYAGGMKSMLSLGGNDFATAYQHTNDYYFNPLNNIPVGEHNSSLDSGEVKFSEIDNLSEVIIKRVNIGEQDLVIYAAQNRRKQVVLYSYDSSTGSFIGKMTLGNNSPYEAIDFEITNDEGMIILAKTYVADARFGRVALFKLNNDQLSPLIR
ncbi:hypothetical protein OO013_08870 [Mangrovivirga sp. M17]|uniref:DUF4374 domain-containing protein n=1 Tax=Mangrovivirga halotolerans TaxID=2993936 RepID=A0ABT3RQB6_9BACT|nr:hypothetical protein [Mangrovivirga halotolerans]MCX2743974.1 hypothetical protein [Mangrovivirga halotolerans]